MSEQKRGEVFRQQAAQYDAWYDSPKGRVLLAIEVASLCPLLEAFPRPYLEVGVGTGRFAQALGIEYGIDPALPPLGLARSRGIDVRHAAGERIPFGDASFGGVLMALTLCFVKDAAAVIREVGRVLKPEGGLVLGLLLQGTPWAESNARRGREGHPNYRDAHFHNKREVEDLLEGVVSVLHGTAPRCFSHPASKCTASRKPSKAVSTAPALWDWRR